jgi:hypothetical protein
MSGLPKDIIRWLKLSLAVREEEKEEDGIVG